MIHSTLATSSLKIDSMLMSIFNKERKQNQNDVGLEKEPKHSAETIDKARNLVEHPNINDVLYGRGEKINSHFGNKTFRLLVSDRKVIYISGNNDEKAKISRDVLNIIAMKGGRFLRQEGKFWAEVSKEKALKKISQALREKQTNYQYLITPGMTVAAPVFRPAYPPASHFTQTNYSRPRTPDIFADAENNDDRSNWRELYASNRKELSQTVHDQRRMAYNTLSQMRLRNQDHQENITNSLKRRISQVEYLNNKVQLDFDIKKRQNITPNTTKPIRGKKQSPSFTPIHLSKEDAPLLELVPSNLLLRCFSFLPKSSQVSLIEVCPHFQKVCKTNASFNVPLKKYLQIQLKKLEP